MCEPQAYPGRATAAFDARDLAAPASRWPAEFAYRGPGDETHGRDAALAREHALRAAFPDATAALDRFVASADRLVAEGTRRGTHSGVLRLGAFEMAPTAHAIVVRFAALFEFAGGAVEREHAYYDRLELRQQLGVVPGGAR